MKDWAKERWRKLYLREALEQRLWSVMARGLRDYLIRVAEDDGALIRDSDEPVEALLLALGAHAEEAELVRSAIVLLCRDGFLVAGARSIFVGNLEAAQVWEPRVAMAEAEALAKAAPVGSSRERVRQFRERQRQAARVPAVSVATGNVTAGVTRPVSSGTSSVTEAVTGNVTSSRGSRNLKSSESFLDLQKDKQTAHPPRSSRARGVTSSVTGPAARVTSVIKASVSVPTKTEDEDEQLDFSLVSEERAEPSIRERALAVRDQPALATLTHPERWPEVVGVARAFARASGLPEHGLGEHGIDPGVRAILALYAAGFMQTELESVAEFVPKQAWWRSKALGLSSLSPEVVRRNLSAAMASDLSPRLAKVLADVARRREVG
jgi:hypothetical protein